MAIEYGDYVGIQGQGVDTSPLQQGVNKFIEKNEQMNKLAAQNFVDNQWQSMMSPYQSAIIDDVSSWNPTSFVGLNPGTALEAYKKAARTKGSRVYNILAQNGEFSPVTFKQKYDQLKASYMPTIEGKLSSFKQLNNFDDIDMKDYVSKNPDLQRFLLNNADPAGLAKDWAMPHTPEGFIPGAIGEVAGDPMRYGMSLGGASAAFGGFRGGIKGGFGGILPGAKAGFASQYSTPFKAGDFGKGKVPSLEEISKQFKGTKYGDKLEADAKKGVKKWGPKERGARTSRNSAYKKATGKKWDPNAKPNSKIGKSQDRWSKAADWGKGKKGVGKGGLQATNKLKHTKGIVNTAKKNSINTLQALVKTHGKRAVLGKLAKHVGKGKAVMMLARLIGGGALAGTGIGAGLGIAMNAYTLYEITNILKKAFKETGGVRRPDQMLFGGGSKGQYLNNNQFVTSQKNTK